jgi:uncharacterized membrane protein
VISIPDRSPPPFANRGYVLMVLTAAMWSGNAIIGRGVHEVVPPIGLAFWRFALALPILLALAWRHLPRDIPLALRRWPTMLALSVLSIAIYNSFIYIGLDHTTAINMVLINTARPVIIVLMSLVFFRVSVTGIQVVGLVLGLVGTAVLVFRGDLHTVLGLELNIGDFLPHLQPRCRPAGRQPRRAGLLRRPSVRRSPGDHPPRGDRPRLPRRRHRPSRRRHHPRQPGEAVISRRDLPSGR